jgi:hypothetical protein
MTRNEPLREASTEELEAIGDLIDDVTLNAPRLLHGDGLWQEFVHEVLNELLARRNIKQLRRERNGA